MVTEEVDYRRELEQSLQREQRYVRILADVGKLDAGPEDIEASDARDVAERVLREDREPVQVARAHHLRAIVAELEHEPLDVQLAHFHAAEEAYVSDHWYVPAVIVTGRQVDLLAEIGGPHEYVDAFLRQLEYWERLDLGWTHQPWQAEARRALNGGFNVATRQRLPAEETVPADPPEGAPTQRKLVRLAEHRAALWNEVGNRRKVRPEDIGGIRRYARRVANQDGDPEHRALAYEVLAGCTVAVMRARMQHVYGHSRLLPINHDEHARNLQRASEELLSAERLHAEAGLELGSLRNVRQQIEILIPWGWRSEAMEAFTRGMDYWIGFVDEHRSGLPYGQRDLFSTCKGELRRSFKLVANRRTRLLTRNDHYFHESVELGKPSPMLDPKVPRFRRERTEPPVSLY